MLNYCIPNKKQVKQFGLVRLVASHTLSFSNSQTRTENVCDSVSLNELAVITISPAIIPEIGF